MPSNRFRPPVDIPAQAITSGRFRNAPPDPSPASTPSKTAPPSSAVRYRRILRYGRLFTVVNPPSCDDLEEALGGWLGRPGSGS